MTQIRESTWVANEYLEGAQLLAEATSKIEQAKDKFEHAMNTAQDNGDPTFATDEVLIKMSIAIADAMNYYKEYMDEAKPQKESDETEEEED